MLITNMVDEQVLFGKSTHGTLKDQWQGEVVTSLQESTSHHFPLFKTIHVSQFTPYKEEGEGRMAMMFTSGASQKNANK